MTGSAKVSTVMGRCNTPLPRARRRHNSGSRKTPDVPGLLVYWPWEDMFGVERPALLS